MHALWCDMWVAGMRVLNSSRGSLTDKTATASLLLAGFYLSLLHHRHTPLPPCLLCPVLVCVCAIPHSNTQNQQTTRLPEGIQTPAERSGLSPSQFSRWLDQHSTADVARGVANALQAAKVEVAAAEASSEGQRAVLGVMKQLCGM